MKLLFLTNPAFVRSQSMSRFADLVVMGMKSRGHEVECLTAKAYFARLSSRLPLQKWLGYMDRFCVFRLTGKKARASLPNNTLVVCLDQALAPWLPIFHGFHCVTHVHDLLSIRAARGEFPNVQVSGSGRLYQHFILRGLKHCVNFVSVSDATRRDLENIVCRQPVLSQTVYNGLSGAFCPGDQCVARDAIGKLVGEGFSNGFLLHVGNNNWYKNRLGVVRIYESWRIAFGHDLPLLLLGQEPTHELAEAIAASPFRGSIATIVDASDSILVKAYQSASALLFPSRAEGFGWPIAEALACGCPVVTTACAPMSEVGGDSAFYIPEMPPRTSDRSSWVAEAAGTLHRAVTLTARERGELLVNAQKITSKFSNKGMLDQFEKLYAEILGSSVTC